MHANALSCNLTSYFGDSRSFQRPPFQSTVLPARNLQAQTAVGIPLHYETIDGHLLLSLKKGTFSPLMHPAENYLGQGVVSSAEVKKNEKYPSPFFVIYFH